MTVKNAWRSLLMQEDLNFLLTNRVPRIALTRLMGWFSRIRSPWLARASIAVWRLFTELDLSDARPQRYESLHACFTRELLPGARPVDPDPAILTSPCDAIVGACGRVVQGQLYQAKGMDYRMAELIGPSQDAKDFDGGTYVTLRLTSAMYHRFHAPHDLRVEHVTYLWGDTWNVNPIALKRVQGLFCRNERAVLRCRLEQGGHALARTAGAGRSRLIERGRMWRPFWSRASACTSWTCSCTCAGRARTRCPATRPTPRARRWAGSSTARPSSSSPRRASSSALVSPRAPACAWGCR